MTIEKTTLKKVLDILSKRNEWEKDQEIARFIKGMGDVLKCPENQSGQIDLIDRNAYFATILWQEEDIRAALTNYGLTPHRAAINEVLNNLSITDMEDCSSGWDVIYNAVEAYERKLDAPQMQ